MIYPLEDFVNFISVQVPKDSSHFHCSKTEKWSLQKRNSKPKEQIMTSGYTYTFQNTNIFRNKAKMCLCQNYGMAANKGVCFFIQATIKIKFFTVCKLIPMECCWAKQIYFTFVHTLLYCVVCVCVCVCMCMHCRSAVHVWYSKVTSNNYANGS